MNYKRRKTRDYYSLSAYLDDALTAQNREKIEARLADEPELREKLKNLRRTKIILGSLPRQQAPRNFVLTPEMVKVRQPEKQPFAATLRMATALAAILLVVMFGVDLLVGRGLPFGPLTSEAPMMEAARVSDDAAPVPLIQWGPAGAEGKGGAGGDGAHYGMGGESFVAEEPMVEMEALPPEEEFPVELPAEEPEEVLPEAELAPLEGIEEEERILGVEELDVEDKDLILGLNPEQAGEIVSSSKPSMRPDQEPILWQAIFRWAQIALAAIVVVGGLVLLVLHRRKHR